MLQADEKKQPVPFLSPVGIQMSISKPDPVTLSQQTPAGSGETSVTIDGVEQPDNTIPLVDDRQEHSVEVRIAVR